MANQRDLVKVISKMNQLTQSRKMQWKRIDNLEDSDFEILENVYESNYKDKILRIYEEIYKYYVDEERWSWSTRIFLSIVDDKGNRLWTFPGLSAINDLMESVKYVTSGAEDLVNSVLGDIDFDNL